MAGPCCAPKVVNVIEKNTTRTEIPGMPAGECVRQPTSCCDGHGDAGGPSINDHADQAKDASNEKGTGDCTDGCCDSHDEHSTHTGRHSTSSEYDTLKGGCCADGEKCDEKCIQIAAAVECQLACENPAKNDRPEGCATCPELKHSHPASIACTSVTEHDHDHVHEDEHDHEHDENDHHDFNQPCNSHLQAAFDKYAAYLEQARCICRSVLPAQLDQCCGSSKPLLPPTIHGVVASSTSVSHHHSHGSKMTQRNRKKTTPKHDDHGHRHSVDSCCVSGPSHQIEKSHGHAVSESPADIDLEKDGQFSHVLLSVVGMDCTGCANNLARALNMPGTRNVQVVFVTGIAEFDVDLEKTSIEAVIAAGERATRYKLTPFSADSQTLDLIISPDRLERFRMNMPNGVEGCETTGKDRYAVAYDPCLIGARKVLAASGGQLLPANDRRLDDGKRILIDKAVKTGLAFALTIPVLVLTWGEDNIGASTASLCVCFVLATLVQTIAYPEFYRPAISSLIYNHVVEMDMLVVISITAAYGYSVVAFGMELSGRHLETGTLFETSTLLIALVLFGRLLASWARKRAIKAVSLGSLQVSTAKLASGEEIDARLLHMGDMIKLQPHTKIVTDAIVHEGVGEVDESILTGESLPVSKSAGDNVIAGTLNGTSLLTAKVSRLPGKNTINDIENLVNQAQNARPKSQELADRVAGYFVPVVVSIAVIVAIVWAVVAVKVQERSANGAAGLSISYAIAVLAISCPCALGLAVPMVLVVAGGVAARRGIIIKSAEVTERGHKVTDVIFDKTGTLTQGTLDVVHREALLDGILGVVKAIVSENQHPVSQAVANAITEGPSKKVDNIVSIPGAGIEAHWDGRHVKAGKPDWLGVNVNASIGPGLTPFCVTVDHTLAAVFGLKSTLRPEAQSVVTELQKRTITVHIVSGDNASAVEHVATSLGIPRENIAASKTPVEKRDYVKALSEAGRTTLFCGDGTNDAVAVAAADIGVQLESSGAGSASDVTRATADVVLLGSLEGAVKLLDVSKAAYQRIIFNFVWSAVYNILAVLLAGGAFVKIRIPPAYAGLGEIVSIAPVIVAAMTMTIGQGKGEGKK